MRIKHPGADFPGPPFPPSVSPPYLAAHATSWGTNWLFHGFWEGPSHKELFTRALLQTHLPASPASPCPQHGSVACSRCLSNSSGRRPSPSACLCASFWSTPCRGSLCVRGSCELGLHLLNFQPPATRDHSLSVQEGMSLTSDQTLAYWPPGSHAPCLSLHFLIPCRVQ